MSSVLTADIITPFQPAPNMIRVQRVAPPPHAVATHGTTPPGQASVKTPYVVQEKPLGSTKHVRIVGIGAGASGLNMIRTLRRNVTNYDLVIYEKNDGVGGTWFENQYPGCRCDVPSHNYQFSWRPNPEWSNFFSRAEEIQQYLCRVCEEENMGDTIKTRHQVMGAWWDEARGVWDLKVQDLSTGKELRDHANFVIDGSGILKYAPRFRRLGPHALLTLLQQLEVARHHWSPRVWGRANTHGTMAQGHGLDWQDRCRDWERVLGCSAGANNPAR